MFEKLEIFQMANAMARHASTRHSMIAQNVAQADTPGYKARDVASFSDTYRDQSDVMAQRATRAGHLAGSPGYAPTVIAGRGSESPNGNNVSLETELMKGAEVRAQHDRALAIYHSSLNILRTSLGRR